MRLFSEMRRALGEGEDFCRVQYTVLDGAGGYFQNVKRILKFSDTEILFSGAKGAVRVEGEGLSLGKYYAGDAVVKGKIYKVERA